MWNLLITSLILALVLTGCGAPSTTTHGEASGDGGQQTGGIEAVFQKKDSNNDGKLTLEEFSSDFLSLSRRGQSPAEVFVRVDANGDGFVTIEEFGSATARW